MGECQALDSLVIPSASSPSGWKFRSNNSDAAEAYMLALRREPRAHVVFPFERLTGLLPVTASKPRTGHSSASNSELFAASPSLVGAGESMTFVPYPQPLFAALPTSAITTMNSALERNTERLAQFTSDWTRQSPNDPAAFEALADILDTRGEILEDRPGRLWARLPAPGCFPQMTDNAFAPRRKRFGFDSSEANSNLRGCSPIPF